MQPAKVWNPTDMSLRKFFPMCSEKPVGCSDSMSHQPEFTGDVVVVTWIVRSFRQLGPENLSKLHWFVLKSIQPPTFRVFP